MPFWCAAIGGLISVSVLAGWTFEIDFLKRIVPGYVFMNPATAIAFILSSVALWLLQSANAQKIRIAQVCAGIVLFTGLVKLCAIFGFFDIGIDRLFFGNRLSDNLAGQPNRMAPNTALNFLLMGAALLLFSDKRKRGKNFPSQYPVMFVLLSSFVAIVGYLYGAKSFYLIVSHNPMAIHTAISFLALAIGLLSSKPRNKTVNEIFSPFIGGQAARRLFPVVIIIPLILGWLRIFGEKNDFYATEMGTAMMVVSITIILGSIVLKNARLINKETYKLIQTQDALNSSGELLRRLGESERSYRQLADAMPQMVWVANGSGVIDYFNQRWLEYTGLTVEELQNSAKKNADTPR